MIVNSWKAWLHGLAGAVIGAAGSSAGFIMVDPQVFHDWKKLGLGVVTSAVFAAALYLKQSPLPKGGQ